MNLLEEKIKCFKILSLILVFSFSLVLLFTHIFTGRNVHELQDRALLGDQKSELVRNIVAKCTTDTNSETCYANEFHTYAKTNSLEKSLTLLSEIEKLDSNAQGCHFIAHEIGAAEVLKDKNNWKEVLKNINTNECSNGYLMGVVEGLYMHEPNFNFNENTILNICNEIRDISANEDSGNSCIHIIGHLLLVNQLGDINNSISICNKLNEGWKFGCLNGVFMENETRINLNAHNIRERQDWNQDVLKEYENICKSYSGLNAKSCWREISHVYSYISKSDPIKTYNYCSNANNTEYSDECYMHSVGVMVISNSFDSVDITLICRPFNIKSDLENECIQVAVNTIIQNTKDRYKEIINLCNSSSKNQQDFCFAFLYNKLDKSDNSKLKSTCYTFPQKYKYLCGDNIRI